MEESDGNYIDRSFGFVFAWRWGLGIFALAQMTNGFF
jgi:hypothetical protein